MCQTMLKCGMTGQVMMSGFMLWVIVIKRFLKCWISESPQAIIGKLVVRIGAGH